jgi:predicted unusual protein kinase regulating ubiquinone biosynthesis (AarF/ABC1/UbiB family)
MEWLDGKPLLSFKLSSQEARDRLALRMFRAWYVPFYNYGVIHGDPHLGNYTVRDDLDLNLLDFGCIRVFRPEFVKGVIDLYWALERDDRDLAADAYRNWGFSKLEHATIDVLNEWAKFLYAPLRENRTRPIEETHSSREGRKVVERVHQKLREVGGVTPPREFVFMDRAAIGLGAVFMHLSAQVNWHRLFMDLIADFDLERLRARQTAALQRHGLPLP